MDILKVQLFKVVIGIAFVVAPFIFWFSFYGLAKFASTDLRKALPWLRASRWVAWILASALFVVSILNDSFHYLLVYGFALFTFSTGLSFPESWLKKRLNLDSD